MPPLQEMQQETEEGWRLSGLPLIFHALDGPVAESYPVQATASALAVLGCG